jgi:hypothetical protein
MTPKGKPHLRVRSIVFAGCGAVLVWLVVSRSLAAYLAEVAPQSALWLSPRQPQALVNLADQALNGPATAGGSADDSTEQTPDQQKNDPDGTPAVSNDAPTFSQNLHNSFDAVDQNRSIDLAAVRVWAESALMNEPLNARGLRILGQVADASKDDVSALKLMRAAGRLSLHETDAIYWLMRKSAEAKDFSAAIYYADVLLRTDPELGKFVVPILAQAAEDKQASPLLKTLLSGDPPWRRQFLAALPNTVTDARTPLELLLALRTNSTPLTSDDIGGYLDFLIAHKFYDLAYYTWLQFLPPEQLRDAGLLFDGNFQVAPSGLPFDWKILPGSGVTVDIVPRSDKRGANALLVDFLYGRVEYNSVTELVMLTPGTYELKGKYKGELAGPRGLKWRIVCAGDANTKIGESSAITGLTRDWTDMAVDFTVPATGCRAQYVRLDLDARMASEQLVSGSMLFGELQIGRVAGPPTSVGASR